MSKNQNINHLIQDVCEYALLDSKEAEDFIENYNLDNEDCKIIRDEMDSFNWSQLSEFLDKLALKYPNSKNHIFFKANRLLTLFN